MRSWASVLVLAAAALAQENGSFEDGLAGWEVGTGAHRGEGPASAVEIDGEVARHGTASLRLSADKGTRVWRMAGQVRPCKPGDRVLLTVAARCKGVVRDAEQYENANALLLFRGEGGQRVGFARSALLRDDRDWIDLHVHALAPEGTKEVAAAVFLSLSGTAWFDDVRLEIAPTDPLDRAAREKAARALRLHLARTYPFFDLEGKPGPDDLPFDPDAEDFLAEVRRMLAPLRDVHVWIDTPLGRLGTLGPNPHPPNWNDAAIRAQLTETLLDKGPHLAGRMGDVGYVRIGAFQAEGFEEAEKALEALGDARALILDVRPNGGGDERLAQRIAQRFVAEEAAYMLAQPRDPTLPGLGGFLEPVPRGLAPAAEPDTRRVAVLQGPHCVSSTELFLCMMRLCPDAVSVGLPSRGSSGNPAPFPLVPGVSVWLPTRRAFTAERDPIEGRGIAPAERVDLPHDGADPTLERALALLK